MLEGMMIGLSTAFSVTNLLMVIGGCLIGTFIGMLPGLGPMSIIAIMIPVAITIGDPSAALILLAGVYYGAIFGGSTSSILINAPGVASTVATSFDGYPLARQGKAGKALTVAAISSFCGGTIGAILLMIFAPMLASVALLFHSAAYFALMVVGLSAIAAFAGTGNVAKALLMTLLGLIMATVGEGALFNMPRFTMGIMDLQSGFGFITLAMAMFALPEAMYLVLDPSRSNEGGPGGEIKDMRITRAEARQIAPVIGRQSVQGFLVGVLPGAGATIASFLGYAVERNIAPKEEQDQFGKGSLKGLAAPESANNAACTGSFVPLLTLGIPGSGTTAVLLALLMTLNITPGPTLFADRPEVVWGLIASLFIANFVLLVMNVPMVKLFVRILTVPSWVLMPGVTMVSFVGIYSLSGSYFDLLLMVAFGVLGYFLRKLDIPTVPVILGILLGGHMEVSLRRAMVLSDGDWTYLFASPISIGLWIAAVAGFILPLFLRRYLKTPVQMTADDDVNRDRG